MVLPTFLYIHKLFVSLNVVVKNNEFYNSSNFYLCGNSIKANGTFPNYAFEKQNKRMYDIHIKFIIFIYIHIYRNMFIYIIMIILNYYDYI